MPILYVSGLAKKGQKINEVLTDAKINDRFSLVKVDAENVIEVIIGAYSIVSVGKLYVEAIPITGTPCQRGIARNQDVKSELGNIFTFSKSGMLLGSSC